MTDFSSDFDQCHDGGSDVGYQRFHTSDCQARTDEECRRLANLRPDGSHHAMPGWEDDAAARGVVPFDGGPFEPDPPHDDDDDEHPTPDEVRVHSNWELFQRDHAGDADQPTHREWLATISDADLLVVAADPYAVEVASDASREITRRGSLKASRVIDVTPSWQAVLPALLLVLEQGSPSGREYAREELARMARVADAAAVGGDR